MQPAVIFNRSRARVGRIKLSVHAFLKMKEYELDTEILEETFRYGEEVTPQTIVRSFDGYTVGIYYALDQTRVFRGDLANDTYVLITCWKEVKKHV